LIALFVAVSYDVNKDGVKVAVLTFTKSAYRLGETVLGVVELNERTSRARVLAVCLKYRNNMNFSY
jgi:RAB6A-GEF complex partner protein 2